MTNQWTVETGAIAVMCLVGALALILPVVLGFVLHRRTGGRWRFFFLGCAIFLVFVLVLEQMAHSLILGGRLGEVIQGNIWLYALYGGVMAGLFEECGRWVAFRVTLKNQKGPGDALMYGAGHGGFEAMVVVGVSMVNNVVLALTMNRGGLAAVEELMGEIPEAGMAALSALATTPAWTYLWAGFERVVAVALHITLSMLVYLAVKRGRWQYWLLAVALHAAVDMAAMATYAFFPIAVTELIILAATVGAALLVRKLYLGEKVENT